MTNELIKVNRIFESKEFGQIRTLIIDGVVWFVGKDVAKALGYKKPENAVRSHVREEDKGVTKIGTPYGTQKAIIINESGLYSLIFASKLESAQRFKHWVTSEVLPQIRQTGSYNNTQLIDNDGKVNLEVLKLLIAQEEESRKQIQEQQLQIEEQQDKIEKMEPKCSYYDKIMSDNNVMCVTPIAKDYGMSATELNKLLHNYGVQYKIDGQWILYQEYADKGYVKSVPFEPKYYNGVVLQTRWTQKGRKFIYELLKEHGILPILERNSTPVLTVING